MAQPQQRLQRILHHLAPIAPAPPEPLQSHTTSGAAAPTAAGTAAEIATADLCDDHPNDVTLLPFAWRNFGQLSSFHGPIFTLKTFEDNHLVRATLETSGRGRVLVIDGGGSLRCALVGDQLAALAVRNGWAGIVVHGAIRDAAVIDRDCPISIKALGTAPVKSLKRGWGTVDVPIAFGQTGGVTMRTGDWIYADADGILVAKKMLHVRKD